MKLYTDEGNCQALKILIATFESDVKDVELCLLKTDEKTLPCVPGIVGKRFPVLVVTVETALFSANAACRYLFDYGEMNVDLKLDHLLDDLLEWESTVLQPSVYTAVVSGNRSNSATLGAILTTVEGALAKQPYLLGPTLSAADVCVFSSVYAVMCSDSKLAGLVDSLPETKKWFDNIAAKASVQKALGCIFKGKPFDSIKTSLQSQPAPLLASARKSAPVVMETTPGGADESSAPPAEVVTPEELSSATAAWQSGVTPTRRQRSHPVLPLAGEKNMLITSALPYVNNIPHLGNIIGSVLSADVFSRFSRLRGYNSLYICGTDEYGTATETKAIEEGLTPQQICDKYHALHAAVYDWFNIDFDFFGRTSTPKQTEIVHQIFWKLHANGYISEASVQQLRCESCKRFLADRFVEGTCPLCAFPDARGDQCDGCGRLINAVELLSPRCKVCRDTPVVRTSQHLFMDLPELEPMLSTHLEGVFTDGIWTNNAEVITKSWIRDGLKPRCISRDLKWGVNVPLEGYTDKVFYVWFDAPIGYLSLTANYTDGWQKWWKNADEVQLYQFMAKDNVPFHSVVFPSALLGARDGWTLVRHLSATEYLNYEDRKFSKSRGTGVFGNDAQETGIPADIWRFYLLYMRPETQDSAFSWDDFAMKNNSELLNNLGNFINRALMFVSNNFAGVVPQMALVAEDYQLLAMITRELRAYIEHLENIRLRDGIRHILNISRLGNQYMQTSQPWVLVKGSESDRARAGTVLGVAVNMSALLSVMLGPYMPAVSETIREQLAAPLDAVALDDLFCCRLPPGHRIGKVSPLFQRIESSVIEGLKKRFAGEQVVKQTKTRVTTTSPSLTKTLSNDITAQGNVVRKLKTDKAEKSLIDAEVTKLLDLKKRLSLAEKPAALEVKSASPEVIQKFTNEVTQQGNVVRKLKTDKAEKSLIDAEVTKLLDLKKRLTLAEKPADLEVKSASPEVIEKLTNEVTQQGDVVRQLKAKKADKSEVDSAVAKLLDLKKQLAAAAGGSLPDATASKKKRGGKKK